MMFTSFLPSPKTHWIHEEDLVGKPTQVKKLRRRWLIKRYNKMINPKDGMQEVEGGVTDKEI
jgi:hypothetical protein